MHYNYEGKKVFYRDIGEGDVIILLPGNTASSAVHIREIEFFSKSYRVICPDYIGYGISERVEKFSNNFWLENALMLIALMKELGIDRYKVIGSSGGGLIGLNMAIYAPEKVELVVADSLIGEYITRPISNKIVEGRTQINEGMQEFWRYAHGEDWDKVIEKDSKMIEEFALHGKSIFDGKLNIIKCPVLILGSLNDDLIPDIVTSMGKICRQIKDSRLLLYSNGRHPVMWTNPEMYKRDVMDFLDRY